MTLAAGTRLGPFEILAPIGAGGMGEVYRAKDTRLGREVAVKVLSSEFSADVDRRKRFEQEARAASALNHPNIVTIHEIGASGETIFIAMEFVDGRTLREVLHGEPLSTKRLLELAYQMADAVAKAHSAGIVHRDLKPENVMVSKDGAVKVLDFGLAKLLKEQPGEVTNAPTAQATQAGTVMGTVGYMSPEQASGKPLDFRTDQFSLGSILYEMATGKRAFQRGTHAETLTAIIREETQPIAAVNAQRARPLPLDRRALPPEGPRGALRVDARPRARRAQRPRASVRGLGDGRRLGSHGGRGGAPSAPRPVARSPDRGRPARGARRRDAPPEAAGPHSAALLPADHLRERHDPHRALRSRRPDDHLQRELGRHSAEAVAQAPVEPRLAAARAPEREPALDLAVRRDGDRDRLPLDPSRRLRRDARPRRADGRRAARRRRGNPGGGLGARRRVA